MLTGNSQENQDRIFDSIAFESKHQQDFERSQSVLEFANNYEERDRTTFEVEGCFRKDNAYPIDLLKRVNTTEN